MATIDEIFETMPDEVAEGGREYLTIDPANRSITVPEAEKIFGVTGDELADRKHFICPRIVGDGLDLASMFIRVNFRNAKGEEDGYLVNDVAVSGEYVTFSWQLTKKVAAYKGAVLFGVCADLPNTPDRRMPDWNTAMATGEVLEGLHPDLGDVEGETSDVVTQLRAETAAQTAAVEACGAEQVDVVKAQGTNTTQEAVAAIQAQGEATKAGIPADYTTLAGTVGRLTRDRAAAIVCQAEGTTIQVTDASNDPLQGLRIFGKSIQAGTPTPDNPVEIVSTPAPVVTVTGGAEDNVQTLTITTPGSLPGIPVASGGNYTDANGQHWIADEVDLARGVYVQRVKRIEYDGSNDESWWAYTSPGYEGFGLTSVDMLPGMRLTGYCNRFPVHTSGATEAGVWLGTDNNIIYVHNAGGIAPDLATWKAWLQANPVTLVYLLAAPVETALTDAEIQAYLTIHSNKPNTTVLNDAGAHMVLEYAADPKAYIDNKLAALVAAQN